MRLSIAEALRGGGGISPNWDRCGDSGGAFGVGTSNCVDGAGLAVPCTSKVGTSSGSN